MSSNIAALQKHDKEWLNENPGKQHPLVGSIIGVDSSQMGDKALRPVLVNHVGLSGTGQLFYGYFAIVSKPSRANRHDAIEIAGASPASYIGEHILARLQHTLLVDEKFLGPVLKVWGSVDKITLNRAKKRWHKTGKHMDNAPS